MHVSFEVATTKLNCKERHFLVALQTMQETAAFSHLFNVFETKKLARGSFSGPSQDKVRSVDFKADELDLESLHKKALQASSLEPSTPKPSATAAASSPGSVTTSEDGSESDSLLDLDNMSPDRFVTVGMLMKILKQWK
jgi:hypothetical protein